MRALLQRLTSPSTQTLRTVQPTSSAVTYIVTTRALPQGILRRFGQYAGLLLRTVIFLAVLLVSWTKWRLTSEESTHVLRLVLNAKSFEALLHLISQIPWIYLAPSALLIIFLILRRPYTEESLTVLRGLGIQLSSTSPSFLYGPTTRFIPTAAIQDIFIHEAFRGYEVRYYLAVVVKGQERVVVVFPKLLPRRVVLEETWRGARKCLWESGRGGEKGAVGEPRRKGNGEEHVARG